MDLRIAPEVHDNVDVMPFVVDHPHIRVSGAGRRTKVPEEGTRGPQCDGYGDFDLRLRSAMARPPLRSAGMDADRPLRCASARFSRPGTRLVATLSVATVTIDARVSVAGGGTPAAAG